MSQSQVQYLPNGVATVTPTAGPFPPGLATVSPGPAPRGLVTVLSSPQPVPAIIPVLPQPNIYRPSSSSGRAAVAPSPDPQTNVTPGFLPTPASARPRSSHHPPPPAAARPAPPPAPSDQPTVVHPFGGPSGGAKPRPHGQHARQDTPDPHQHQKPHRHHSGNRPQPNPNPQPSPTRPNTKLPTPLVNVLNKPTMRHAVLETADMLESAARMSSDPALRRQIIGLSQGMRQQVQR
eukprot:TRINITY_DN2105_c0_g1_i1.p1 TRINITY_DN2105_c0_g1~~TRINITY_DN2105_c0_g1_i1.p1  ORF type:complete len:245 (+),score=8.15 TRINITY_DN2105_c0_g1_i1:31-735(+)